MIKESAVSPSNSKPLNTTSLLKLQLKDLDREIDREDCQKWLVSAGDPPTPPCGHPSQEGIFWGFKWDNRPCQNIFKK